jgi:hypothetical protein
MRYDTLGKRRIAKFRISIKVLDTLISARLTEANLNPDRTTPSTRVTRATNAPRIPMNQLQFIRLVSLEKHQLCRKTMTVNALLAG